MKLKHYLLLLIVFLATVAHAQQIKIRWSEEEKFPMLFQALLPAKDGGSILKLAMKINASNNSVTPTFFRYDTAFNQLAEKPFFASEKQVAYQTIFQTSEGVFMWLSSYDKKQNATTYFSQRIDPVTLNTFGPVTELATLGAADRFRQSDVVYELSKDSSKVLLFGTANQDAKKQKDHESYYLSVFDKEMNKLWDKNVVLPYEDRYVDVYDYFVTNDGNVGVVIKLYDKEVKRESIREDGARVPSYQVKVLMYGMGAEPAKEYIIENEHKFIQSLELAQDAGGKATLLALYKNKAEGRLAGYFLASVGKDADKPELTKATPFPASFIAQIDADDQGSTKESDPGLSTYFHLVNTALRNNNTVDYLLEYNSGAAKNAVGKKSKPGSGDIIDISMATDGTTKYARIPMYCDDCTSSTGHNFLTMPYNNNLLVFYIDNAENIGNDPDKGIKKAVLKHAALVMATITETGAVHRRVVLNQESTKLRMYANFSWLAPGQMLLYAHKDAALYTNPRDMIGILEIH